MQVIEYKQDENQNLKLMVRKELQGKYVKKRVDQNKYGWK